MDLLAVLKSESSGKTYFESMVGIYTSGHEFMFLY